MKMFALLAVTALVGVGCQSGPKPAPGMVNAGCPFTGSPVGEGASKAEFDGKTVGFCCPGCKVRWDGWSDEQKAGFVNAQ